MKTTKLYILLALLVLAAIGLPVVLWAVDEGSSCGAGGAAACSGSAGATAGCCGAVDTAAKDAGAAPGATGPSGPTGCPADCTRPCCAARQDRAAHLAAALKALDQVEKAVKEGDQKAALAALDQARQMVKAEHEAAASAPAGVNKPINATCPIMGSAIDPKNVPAGLVREYRGQKVAFCCGGCPAAWDRLTDAERDAKLAKAHGN